MDAFFSISVVIPTFNRSDLLQRALKSVMKQSLKPDEIIVIDDGSTDTTKSMIKNNFPQIKYFNNKKKGVSSARNMGILKSSHNWICFLDSDDEWNECKLSKQRDYIKKNIHARFIHTNEIWYKNGKLFNQKKIHKKVGGFIFENCLKLCCISPSSVMIRRDLFRECGNFDENFEVCEDYELWLRISSKSKIDFLEEKLLIKHGGHKDQLSKMFWGMDRFRVKAIEKNLIKNIFSENQINLALKHLLLKIDIIMMGAKKRKNVYIYNKYLKKQKYWNLRLNSLVL